MMLHETLASTPATTIPRPTDTGRPIAGGEAWIVPHEPTGHPWLSASMPAIRITDRRPHRGTNAA